MKKIIIYTLLTISILIAGSCSKVPITGRHQLHLLPASKMLSLSFDNYNKFIGGHTVIPATTEDAEMVTRVGKRLAAAATQYLKNNHESKLIKGYKWEFHLVQDNEVNAWCMPGGKIVVYTGILPLIHSDTDLAVVLGHEISHAIARHGNERMSQQLLVKLGGTSLQVAMQDKPQETQQLFMSAYGAGSGLGVLAFSRKQEAEADKMGLVFMAVAGYDPRNAITFWKRMETLGGNNTPTFLRTHPTDAKRIEGIKDFLPEALTYYYNNKKK